MLALIDEYTWESLAIRVARRLGKYGEISYSLKEAQVVIEKWRLDYNTSRSHSALGYRPPAPAACSPWGANPSSQPMAMI
jgi:transposase InsO family protein